jgi:hypothetical protein
MLMMKERRPAFRTIEGWARSILLEAGAIRECEVHGWMRDRADPHAYERALLVARGGYQRTGIHRRHLSGMSARCGIEVGLISSQATREFMGLSLC